MRDLSEMTGWLCSALKNAVAPQPASYAAAIQLHSTSRAIKTHGRERPGTPICGALIIQCAKGTFLNVVFVSMQNNPRITTRGRECRHLCIPMGSVIDAGDHFSDRPALDHPNFPLTAGWGYILLQTPKARKVSRWRQRQAFQPRHRRSKGF